MLNLYRTTAYPHHLTTKEPLRQTPYRAIARLLASGLPIANECHVLNHWR
jgi:hypothetical protein